jgi:hypothetical protein
MASDGSITRRIVLRKEEQRQLRWIRRLWSEEVRP